MNGVKKKKKKKALFRARPVGGKQVFFLFFAKTDGMRGLAVLTDRLRENAVKACAKYVTILQSRRMEVTFKRSPDQTNWGNQIRCIHMALLTTYAVTKQLDIRMDIAVV